MPLPPTGGANCLVPKGLAPKGLAPKGLAPKASRQIFVLCLTSSLFLAAWRCPLGALPLIARGTGEDVKSFAADFSLDTTQATADLDFMTSSPHPLGSSRQWEVAKFLARRIEQSGARAEVQEFKADIPNAAALSMPAPLTRTVTGRNIYAWPTTAKPATSCVVLLASHYDTKIVEGISYVGANDSGSSSVGLLQLLRHVQNAKDSTTLNGLKCRIGFVWFDGEESTLANWSDGETSFPQKIVDHTWGSRYAASQSRTQEIAALVLFDMIGSPELRLTRDSNSSAPLMGLLEESIRALGYPADLLSAVAVPVEDDHIPFLDLGIPAINIIDFNDLSVWHRPGDDAGRINPKSIEKALRIGVLVALAAARDPQAIR